MWTSVGTIAPHNSPGTFAAPRVGELPSLEDPRLLVLATAPVGAFIGWALLHTMKGAVVGGAAGSALALAAILVGGTPYGGRSG